MARYFANPKPYAKTLNQRFTERLLTILVVLSALATALLFSKHLGLYFAITGLFAAGMLLTLYKQVEIKMGKNDRGEDAEYEIKNILMTLPYEYVIFQNVPIKKNLDIDFVLVGPTGIYAIEVKSHRRFNIFYGGDFIGQTSSEALGLRKYLKQCGIDVYVNAALVFSRAFVKYGFKPQRGVYVIGKKFLLPLLASGKSINFDRFNAEAEIMKLYNS